MNKNFILVMCIEERKGVFGGKEGEYYLIDANSIENINGTQFAEIYSLEKDWLGFYQIDRFMTIE